MIKLEKFKKKINRIRIKRNKAIKRNNVINLF
jgi:hypothetical protein